MSFIDLLGDMTKGAVAGVALVAALPVCGAVGAVSACGAAAGAVVGIAAAVTDHFLDEDEDG